MKDVVHNANKLNISTFVTNCDLELVKFLCIIIQGDHSATQTRSNNYLSLSVDHRIRDLLVLPEGDARRASFSHTMVALLVSLTIIASTAKGRSE